MPRTWLLVLLLAACGALSCQDVRDGAASGSRIRRQHDLHPVDPYVARPADLESHLHPYRAVVKYFYRKVIGNAAQTLYKGIPEGDLGNFAADALKSKAEQITGERIDLAVANNGGLRSPLFGGKITAGDIYELMPFDNEIVVVEMKGSNLMKLLGDIALRGGEPLSGAELVIGWGKVQSARVGGVRVEGSRTYRVATISYMADGYGGFPSFKLADASRSTGKLYRDALIEAISEISARDGAVRKPPGGRIRVAAP